MKDAQKPDHVSLNNLISRLKEGRFVIPDFQREFEWMPWDIKDLMRSIFLDYYIGSLLLWKGKDDNFNDLSCEVIYGFENNDNRISWDEGDGKPEYIVLDGQQRLTALYYAFVAPDVALPKRVKRAVYFVQIEKFVEKEYDEAFFYEWLPSRLGKRIENQDEQSQFSQHKFPLALLGAGRYDLPNWLQGYEKYWNEIASTAEDSGDQYDVAIEARRHAKNADSFGQHVKDITEQYQISYVELDKDLGIGKVCDIFSKINSTGRTLSVFDLISALLKPKGLQLKHMWRKSSTRLEFVEESKMDVYVLQVMSILQQSYCSPRYLYNLLPGREKNIRTVDGESKKILIPDKSTFEKKWDEAVFAIEFAIGLLKNPQEFGVISRKYLPYASILPVFSALQATCQNLPPNQQLGAKRKIKYWYWASVFTNRYSGSVESTTARDYLDVRNWIDNDDAEPSLIREFKNRFPNLELRKEVKRGNSIYNGIFNLLILRGARDWITGHSPQKDDLDDHHIIPAAWGNKHINNSDINTILNRTPLSKNTNRSVINKRLPSEYLPELIEKNGEDQVCEILESHLISRTAQEILMRDPFGESDYDEFLSERQRTFLDAIGNLLIKDHLDLDSDTRDLDSRIEKIELEIRKYIVDILENNPRNLPPHILQKIDEAILRISKKDATIDPQEYEMLEAKLEYADLRELQEIITSKTKWNLFQNQFTNKETLNVRFDQLASLRNSIRHSRTVTEILRRDGQAALLWFEKILKL